MEPFETDVAFVVTVVFFNFDPSKSLPVLAIVKGQRRGLNEKKKKSWCRCGNQIAAGPVVLALRFLEGDHET